MIAIIGPEFFGARIVNSLHSKNIDSVLITESFMDWKNLKEKLKSHKIAHFIFSPTTVKSWFRALLYCKILRKTVIIHWIGSDVLVATTKPFWRFITKISQPLIAVNLATAPNLVKELKGIGIDVKYQPIPVYSMYEIEDLPSENKIAVYLPDKTERDWKFYQGDMIKKIVNAFPNIEFIITGNSGKKFDEKNVKCYKWVEDMSEIYRQVKAVIRLPIHDGTSGTSIEALSMGKTMITSSDSIPYCEIVNNFDDARRCISKMMKNIKNNSEGSKFVHENFNNVKLTDELILIYNSLKNSKIEN